MGAAARHLFLPLEIPLKNIYALLSFVFKARTKSQLFKHVNLFA